MSPQEPPARVRLDKWLWAARFFKTRGLATEAAQGGRVHVNGTRAKPAKDVQAGDEIEVTVGQDTFQVEVLAVAERRGPASEARLLYRESEESRAVRERRAAERRLARSVGDDLGERPTKRDRRRIDSLRGRRPRG